MLQKFISDGIIYQVFSGGLRVLGFADKNDKREKVYIPKDLWVTEKDGTTKQHEVKEIVKCAFADSANLQFIVIPDTVSLIGHYAFSGCHELRKVYTDVALVHMHSSNILCMQRGAFQNCSSLTDVKLNKTVGWLANDVFNSCQKLTTFEGEIRDIAKGAFNGCSIESLTLAKNSRLHEGSIEGSGVKTLHILDETLFAPQKIWKWIKKADIKICCPQSSKLVNLAYEGVNIEIR